MDFPHGKQYFRITATFGTLPRACNLKCADCNPAIDSFRVRDLHPIPLFSEQACVSDLPREAGQSLHFDEAASVLRVAHVPQKPWYSVVINFTFRSNKTGVGQCTVISFESSFAKLAFFVKRCIRSFRYFLRKQGQLH